MGVRVAYGPKENIDVAIQSGVIPTDSIIITNDESDSELLFYDINGNLKTVAERTRFESLAEATQWAKQYPCKGYIFTIHNGAEWQPYIVQDNNTLAPFRGEVTEVTNIKRIDGGNAAGI